MERKETPPRHKLELLSSPEASVVAAKPNPVLQTRGGSPSLIVGSDGDAIEWKSRNPAAHRARRVDVSPWILVAAEAPLAIGDRIELPLFDGAYAQGTVTEARHWGRDGATFTATARLDEDPHGFMVLSSVGGVLRVLVLDSISHQVYQLRYDVAQQSHVLLHVDEGGSEQYACANDPSHEIAQDAAKSDNLMAGAVGTAIEDDGGGETVLDVMVAYTPNALAIEGSLANMEANISQAIAMSNTVHSNSETQVNFNLVHSVEVDYTESGSSSTILQYLSNDNDGVMDAVHGLRDYYGADFVSLFLDTDSLGSRRAFGGVAWRPDTYDRPDRAFSLVRVNQSDTTSYTTVHEISHNMGNGHSKTQATQSYSGDGVASYAAGWQWVDPSSDALIGHCSVMTYEDFNSSGGDEYVRVAHLSNPSILYQGNATGDAADGDAARSIREGRLIYAAFREPFRFVTVDTFPYAHSFETADPVWAQDPFDSHDWTLDQSGGTPSEKTGPEVGASEGQHYAYVEASYNYNKSASLLARFDFINLPSVQLVFDYHMLDDLGGYMGDLSVEVSTDQLQTWTPVKVLSGNSGDYWRRALVDLSVYAGQVVYLRFLGEIGNYYPGDIAIDRIRVGESIINASPQTFMDWLALSHPTLEDPTESGNDDGDRFSNYTEYAFDLSPDQFDSIGNLIEATYDPQTGRIRIEFRRGRDGVRYQVKSTANLADWSAAQTVWDSAAASSLAPEGEIQAVTLEIGDGAEFYRVTASD